jgi:CheY-like chemotaxis protein/Tfp pilus assembly protein PilZ
MKPKILLVDDVAMFLDLQKMFLRLSSVRILTARDGTEALELAGKERPSLIFMDLHMPNMDGVECCSKIKADPELKSIPVVMITSEGREEDRDLCLRAGCDGFMTKPIDRVPYLETARRFLPAVDRRETRVPFCAKVKFRAFGLTLTAEIRDISRNGVYIETDYQLDAETPIDLVFALQSEKGAIVQGRGRVAWINSKKEKKKPSYPDGIGVELTAMTEESNRNLNDFIEIRER